MSKHATITTDGKKILAKIEPPYKPGSILAHQIPGCRAMWDKSVEPNVFLGWSYPLDMVTCRKFRQVFGDDLTILPPLWEWSKEAVGVEQSLEEYREEVGTHPLDRVAAEAPALYAALQSRPFQIAGVGFILAGMADLLGDDPGLGKTLQAIAAVIESGAKTILVACRRTAMRNVWENETFRWTEGIEPFVAQGTRAQRERVFQDFAEYDLAEYGPSARKMLIVNVEMIRAKRVEICPETKGDCKYKPRNRPPDHPKHTYKSIPDHPFLHDQKWDAIIFDESHNVLASTANVQSKRIALWRFGAMQLQLADGGLKIALSGTPFRSHLEKMWGTANWLRPKDYQFSSFWRWAESQFRVTNNGYAKVIGNYDPASDRYVAVPLDKKAWDDMLRTWYLKRTKADVVKELPPIAYAGTPIAGEGSPNYVQLEMAPEQAKMYRQMDEDAEATLASGRLTATGVLAEITRKRQFANSCHDISQGGNVLRHRKLIPVLPSNKVEWILNFMAEREDVDTKVVIASSFSSHIEFIARTLRAEGYEVLTLTGATPDRDRADLVARFQNPEDPLKVVCINRIAGGESITLDRADEMVVLEPPWVSDQDEQLEARIHRVSRIHQVTIYRLVSIGTIDVWMAGLTDEQRELVRTASPRKLSEMIREAEMETAR